MTRDRPYADRVARDENQNPVHSEAKFYPNDDYVIRTVDVSDPDNLVEFDSRDNGNIKRAEDDGIDHSSF